MGKINRPHNQFTPKPGKSAGLLPTPTMMNNHRPMGRAKPGSSSSDGDTGKSGWRTYAQAKNSEAFFKKKRHQNPSSNSKGYRQNTTGYQQQNRVQRERTPKPERSQSSDEKGPSSSSSNSTSTGSTEDNDVEIIAHVRRNTEWNQRQQRVPVKTGPPFDPYQPIPLGPPPSQQQVAKMYEEMLYSAAAENSLSTATTAKGLRTAGDNLRFAEEHSPGYFVKTSSKFGNSVMPVLPRL